MCVSFIGIAQTHEVKKLSAISTLYMYIETILILYKFKFIVTSAIKYFYTMLTMKNSEIYIKHAMHNFYQMLLNDFTRFVKIINFRKKRRIKKRKDIEDAVM